MDILDEISDASIFLLQKFGILLHYLFRLNYEIVSSVLDLAQGVLWVLTNVLIAVRVAIIDFIDQYGEWCTTALGSVAWLISCILSAGKLAFFAVVNTLIVTGRVLYAAVMLPVVWATNFANFVNSTVTKTSEIVKMPMKILNGAGMIFYGLWDGLIFILSSIWNGFVSLLYGFGKVIALVFGTVWSVITRPFEICGKALKFAVTVPSEAFFGLLICLLVVYLWKTGALSYFLSLLGFVLRRLFRIWLSFVTDCVKTFVRWSLFISLEITAIFVPWVAVGLRIFRLVSGPILEFCRKLIRWLQFIISLFQRVNRRNRNLQREPLRTRISSSDSTIEDRLLCVICADEEKSVILLPCGHVCLCRNCAENVMNRDRKCPLCRATARDAVEAYL